jgi:DNA primase catalytic core
MARIPDEELEQLKRGTDLAALVRSKGVELKKHGAKDLCGLSPFTDEKTASFIVTPGKNLWHCMSSGNGGSVIDFIMQYDGVSFREAVELLKSKSPTLYKSAAPVKKSTVPKLPPPVAFDSDDNALFEQVLDYYGKRLKENQPAIDYLKKRGLWHEAALKRFKIGFADRTLGLTLPHKNRKDGAEIRTRLQRLGIYRESGHEHFNGSLVFPVLDEGGNVQELYGRKVGSQKSGIYHLYLPGPHRGIWNPACLKSSEVILTESVIDALTFWVNGFENVTCIYGTEGFTDDHLEAFKKHKTQKIYLAYDRDKAGERAAERDAARLQSIGIECFRVRFPAGHDANEYALKVIPAAKSLGVLLNSAEWLGKGQVVESKTENQSSNDGSRAPSSLVEIAANLAADACEAPKAAKEIRAVQDGDDYTVQISERSYRVRGLHKNGSLEVLKINLRVLSGEWFFLDTFDLYRAKEREHFIRAAAEETGLETEPLKRDLGKVLLALESVQEARLKLPEEEAAAGIEMEAKEKDEALALLKSPDLLDRILADFERCGVVGEATNKLTGYLAAVSRKLDKPLAVIVQSTSAAGKTALMESVLAFMPEEERIKYSAMTGQSLYYLGETNLKNKILAIVEEEGAEKASYALKLLQSEGELTIASTGKDPNTGRMQTEEYHVEGPVMIFLTTTAIDIDEELLNRCLVLTVDEGRAQTEAIHRMQREAETFEGLKRKVERERVLTLHRNAQRLLEPLAVVNPYAPQLTFLSDRTRTRRDHVKYLTLIRTIALLHQHQREIKTHEGLRYIEATLADIEAANGIAADVLMRSLDELPPQTCKLLLLIDTMLKSREKEGGDNSEAVFFTRRALREFTGWGTTQVKLHLDRLQEHEYLATRTGSFGRAFEYELIVDVQGRAQAATVGLLDLAKLKNPHGYDVSLSGQRGDLSGICRPVKNSPKAQKDAESVQPVGVSGMHKGSETRKAS